MKDTLRLLFEMYHGDSKKASEEAEERIIAICKPIIKKFYKIVSFLKVRVKPFDGDYLPNRGGFSDISISCNEQEIYLEYHDSCMGDPIDDTIVLPVDWIVDTENQLKAFFEKCKEKKTKDLMNNINNQYKEIERLKELYREANNMDFSNIKFD